MIDVDGRPVDIAVGDDAVWVAANATPTDGDDSDEVRIGLITVREGAYGLTSAPSVAGAELPSCVGARPWRARARRTESQERRSQGSLSGSSSAAATRRARPLLPETRRLVEQVGVDVLIGPGYIGEGLAIKEYARKHADVTYVATSPAQALTLDDPVSNMFRFTLDGAQLMAGLGAYAYNELGLAQGRDWSQIESFDYTQVAASSPSSARSAGRSSRCGYRARTSSRRPSTPSYRRTSTATSPPGSSSTCSAS